MDRKDLPPSLENLLPSLDILRLRSRFIKPTPEQLAEFDAEVAADELALQAALEDLPEEFVQDGKLFRRNGSGSYKEVGEASSEPPLSSPTDSESAGDTDAG